MKLSHAALAAMLLIAGGQAMACYQVFDANNRTVYSGMEAPVDMSRPLHETLPARFPGATMVFDNNECPTQGRLRVASTTGRSPLLTDKRTAESMGLPHTDLGNGVSMIRERPDSMRAGVTISESGLPRDDTRAMGAGPAQPQPQQQQQQQAATAPAAGPANRPANPQFITPNGAPPPGVSRSTTR